MAPLTHTPGIPLAPGVAGAVALVRRLGRWPVESQQQARRNAMLACTADAARRAEREEVQGYLDALAAERRARTAHG